MQPNTINGWSSSDGCEQVVGQCGAGRSNHGGIAEVTFLSSGHDRTDALGGGEKGRQVGQRVARDRAGQLVGDQPSKAGGQNVGLDRDEQSVHVVGVLVYEAFGIPVRPFTELVQLCHE
ncbi:hypothetical protein M6B22_05210 [Jatrophihabitans cynanchi]|uniref:Uncharacterized protein n=1 Tax=Jatrophihabitans cynanchi TaxID=2944128 RepID=A0ABY7K004_9ACTN|nr:hypothetical protein [Jatrophihabitans sp. SB3-54]WAX58166.1 hypothetical protein M6B22_05210 [Jatrophihabitans sp. SB3-54]